MLVSIILKRKHFQSLSSFCLSFSSIDAHACKCPTIAIEKEADRAYDIVVGRVVSGQPEELLCNDYGADFLFEFEVEFSYKGQLAGRTRIFAGQGVSPVAI